MNILSLIFLIIHQIDSIFGYDLIYSFRKHLNSFSENCLWGLGWGSYGMLGAGFGPPARGAELSLGIEPG